MIDAHTFNAVAEAVKLAVAPVFLLTALGSMMGVLTNAFFNLKLAGTVALFFILAMVTFITALMLFLREIHMAIASVRF